jgi:hypothetical protein
LRAGGLGRYRAANGRGCRGWQRRRWPWQLIELSREILLEVSREVRGVLRKVLVLEVEGQCVVERGFEIIDHLAHRARPLPRILRQHPRDQCIELWGDLLGGHERWRRLLLHAPGIEMRIVWRPARQQLVSQRP